MFFHQEFGGSYDFLILLDGESLLLFRPEMKMHIFPVKNQFSQNDQFLGRNLHQHYRLKIIASWIFIPLAGELLGN